MTYDYDSADHAAADLVALDNARRIIAAAEMAVRHALDDMNHPGGAEAAKEFSNMIGDWLSDFVVGIENAAQEATGDDFDIIGDERRAYNRSVL